MKGRGFSRAIRQVQEPALAAEGHTPRTTMTLLDLTFSYGSPPGERQLRALDEVREVYGVRCISFDEKAHTIRVEYDASRLSENDIAALLRDAAIDLREQLRAVA